MPSRLLGVLLATSLLLAGCADRHVAPALVVGAPTDADSAVLAEVYAAALRYRGATAWAQRESDPLAKLDTGEVDVVPGFTGRLLQTFVPGSTAVGDDEVYRAMVAALPEGVAAGDYVMSAQDTPAVAVTRATADSWGDRSLASLVRHCEELKPGSVAGATIPSKIGTCQVSASREFASETLLFDALRGGGINAAWTSGADPGLPNDVVVLADGEPALLQADNVVPLYRRNELSDDQVLALNEVAGELDTAALADMRRQVADGRDPRQVAEAWLAAHPLGH